MKKSFKNIFTVVLLSFALFLGCCVEIFAKDSILDEKGSNIANTCDPALISIQTKSQAQDVLDFIDKPVSSHISSSMFNRGKRAPAPYYEDCLITVTDEDGNVTLSDEDAKVKVRGNWTTSYDKKPLRINFDNKQSMLGLNNNAKTKDWVLLAAYKDASMLRDRSAFAMAKEILGKDGYYAADSKLVELKVNDKYYGMYLLTELQEINENRVNITQAKEGYEGTDIGYLLEYDGYYNTEDELQRFHVDYNNNAPLVPYDGKGGSGQSVRCLKSSRWDMKQDIGFTIKNDIYSTKQRDFVSNFVNNVYKIMYEASYNNKAFCFDNEYNKIYETTQITPREAIEKVVDVQSLVDMYILSELTCDADIYWSSFYMDVDFGKDGNKKLTFEAPWDFDSGLGNKDRCLDGKGYYACNIVPDSNGGRKGGGMYDTVNPWLVVLAYNDWYIDLIQKKWTSVYESNIFEEVENMIIDESEKYSMAFDRNYAKWNNIINNKAFVNELSKEAKKCKTQMEAAQFLAKWIHSRVDFMNTVWNR